MISYGDPEHDPVPGQPKGLLYAGRGEVLGGESGKAAPTNAEVDRLFKMGAISKDKTSLSAKLALAGQRPDARVAPQYISLTSPQEQIRAAQNIARTGPGLGPSSNKRDLARLSLGDLQIMAEAFGLKEVADTEDKDQIIGALTGDYEGASTAADIAEQHQIRDEAQAEARELKAEPGLIGTDVTAAGVSATTGEKTVRRESKLQQEGADVKASAAVKKHAAEQGVDLSTVQGSGEDGRITKEDVDTAAANQSQ